MFRPGEPWRCSSDSILDFGPRSSRRHVGDLGFGGEVWKLDLVESCGTVEVGKARALELK
jgi:hypothetical protein